MKKIIYIFLLSVLMVGCTTFDEYNAVSYGDGPTVAIDIQNITDSAFTVKLIPGQGTGYYSYVIQKTDEAITADNYTLLKGKYSGILSGVLNAKDSTTFTSNMRKSNGTPLCTPNTTYHVYAVAANDKGVAGVVAEATVITSDGDNPTMTTFNATAAAKSVKISFSEEIERSMGKVFATYYKEFDIDNPETVEVPEVNISVAGSVATVTLPDAHDGIFANVTWEQGAFTDPTGNKCPAYTIKGFSQTTGAQQGVKFRVPTVAFAIADNNFTAPKVGSFFTTPSGFAGEVTFDFDIYRVDDEVNTGDFKVFFVNDSKTTYVNYGITNWSISGNKLLFGISNAPQYGGVGVNIAAGLVFDVYGNPNAAYTSTTTKWDYVEYMGTYSFTYTSDYDGVDYTMDNVLITKSPNSATQVYLYDFFNHGSKVTATYDLTTHTMSIPNKAKLGFFEDSGTTYGLITYNRTGATPIVFTISNDETTMTCASQLGIVYTDETYASLINYYDKLNNAVLTKLSVAPVKKYNALSKVKSVKHHKGHPF